jgi:hypothetical protein
MEFIRWQSAADITYSFDLTLLSYEAHVVKNNRQSVVLENLVFASISAEIFRRKQHLRIRLKPMSSDVAGCFIESSDLENQ